MKIEGNLSRRVLLQMGVALGCGLGAGIGQVPAAAPAAAPATSDSPGGPLRRIDGRYVTLLTDLPAAPAVDELARVFDQAVPQWADYFRVPVPNDRAWQVRGFLIRDRSRFQQQGLLPADLPPFLHGYQRGNDFWVLEQPSEYFLRHLVLHEGTHAFMRANLGGAGPPWYMEGIAELLATHRWSEERLTLNVLPQRREEVPYWGRIKLIQDAVARGEILGLGEILQLDPIRFRQVEPYAWTWAAATFFDRHPRWRTAFRRLPSEVQRPERQFTGDFWRALQKERAAEQLREGWQLFVHHLDYGYDPAEDEVLYRPAGVWRPGEPIVIRTDLGWQATGAMLQAGSAYRIRAEGRYQLGKEPQIWWCEPGGVTLEYHAGLPLGMLVAAIHRPMDSQTRSALLDPRPIGAECRLVPEESGQLFLQINDRPGRRDDNEGQVRVWIEPEQADATD